jgi:hypothetical protein
VNPLHPRELLVLRLLIVSQLKKSASSVHDPRHHASRNSMKKKRKSDDDLRSEYDFATMQGGVRGKYAERVRANSNIVLLEPDIAKAFPNDSAVNSALRTLLKKSPPARS